MGLVSGPRRVILWPESIAGIQHRRGFSLGPWKEPLSGPPASNRQITAHVLLILQP